MAGYKKKIAGITIELDADTSKLVKSLDNVSTKISKIGKSIEGVGKSLTTNLTVPIATGFGAAIKTAADFDSQMSKVQAIAGATGDEYDQLAEKAREMGSKTKFSATESGEAMEYMAMAGWKTEEMLNGIDGIMNLAAASGEELGTTSDIVTDALTAFGMSADQAGRFADILAAASTNANTNVSMMGESFKYVAPVAGSLGYSAEDVATALGIMANSGIKASMAGTSLRNMFNRMAKPTKESYTAMTELGILLADSEGNAYSFREIMEQIRGSMSGITVDLDEYNAALDTLDSQLENGEISQEEYDETLNQINVDLLGTAGAEKARYAAMLGGMRAMSGLLAIANASDEEFYGLANAIDTSSDAFAKLADGSVVPLNEALASGEEIVEQYNGQAEAMAATMQDNLTGDLTVLKSQLQELAISLGELMMPLLRELVGKIQGVVDWLNNLSDEQKEHILKIAAVVAAVGPVILVIGKVITAISSVVSIVSGLMAILPLLAGPVGIVIAAITALVAIGVALYKNWDKIKEAAGLLWECIKVTFEFIKDKVVDVFNGIKEKTTETFNNIKNAILDSPIVQAASKVWGAVKDTVSGSLANIKKSYDEHGGGLKGAVSATMTGIKEYYKAGFNFIDNLTDGKLSDMVAKVKSKMTAMFDTVKDKFDAIKDAVKGAIDFIKDLFSGDIDFPHFNLPHFTIDGGELPWGIGGKGSPPEISVEWYAKAMDKAYMLNGASIFGAMNGKLLGGGETGSEMIIGTNKLMDMIAKAKGGDTVFNNQFTINGTNMDPEQLAHEISYYMNLEMKRMQCAQGLI